MMSKKEEIEIAKKSSAEHVRYEKKLMKIKKNEESLKQQSNQEKRLLKLERLEDQFKILKDNRELSQNSSKTHSTRSNDYLDLIKQIHIKAKNIMRQNSSIENFPKPAPLDQEIIINQSQSMVDHIRVPIFLPKSIIEKSKNLKPPTFNHVLKSGEVISVHLLTESMPTFDPLVKAEARIPKNSLGREKNIIADISYNNTHNKRLLKSVSPIKHKESPAGLSPPIGLHVIREATPRDKFERYSFRENDYSESTNESQRS